MKAVIEAHKGVVLVHSDEKGTTFKFELPRNIAHAEKETIRATKNNDPNAHRSNA